VILAMLDGAAIFAAGLLAGRFLPGRHRGPKRVEPICGCEHDLSHHAPDGGGGGSSCSAIMKTYLGASTGGYRFDPCTCRQYTGPRIMDPGYVAREITD
jgi:hypothetical protein